MTPSPTESSGKSGVRPNPLLPQPGPPVRKRASGWLAWLLLLVGIGGAVAFFIWPSHPRAAAPTSSKAEPEPVTVTLATVTKRPIRRAVPIVGTFFGLDEVALSPKVEGRVAKILKDVGDFVRPGELLLQVEEIDFRLAVDEAQRALDLELARLGLSAPPDGEFDVKKLPSVLRAESLSRNAVAKRERVRNMGQAATPEQREQVETDCEIAEANYRQALMDAEATWAAVRLRQASLATAKQRLSECQVRVPSPSPQRQNEAKEALAAAGMNVASPRDFAYVIAERMVSEGEMVRGMAGGPLFRLVLDRPLKLQGTVPERHATEVRVGQPVSIHVEAFPGEAFSGIVARVNPTVDRASRTFQVEVLVPNLDRRLRAGSFAKAEILAPRDVETLTVPEQALETFAGVTKVFVVEKGLARAVPVRTGMRLEITGEQGRRESWLEVSGELKPGQQVASSGQSQLADGTPVKERTSPSLQSR